MKASTKIKRTIAATLALLIVAGYAPYTPLSEYLPDMYTNVSAYDGKLATVSYIDYTYTDNGITSTFTSECENYNTLASNTTTWNNGWYVVDHDLSITGRVTVNGNNVNLILCDGCTLTIKDGICVSSGKKLTVYGQSEDAGTMGVLAARNHLNAKDGAAGIGGNNGKASGTIVINGGQIKTCPGLYSNVGGGAGIGGGYKGANGATYINGGIVTITSPIKSAAGIGGGSQAGCGKIVINGGKVTTQGYSGAGIGCGYNAKGGTVYINGGDISAITHTSGMGIGGSNAGSATVYIRGGTINARSAQNNAIGSNVTITGGEIKAYAATNGKVGIGATVSFGEGMVAIAGNMEDLSDAKPCVDYPTNRTKCVKVWKHTHSFSYSASENVFTLHCAEEHCNFTNNDLKVILNAPDKYYDGNAYASAELSYDSLRNNSATEFNTLVGDSVVIGDIEYYKGGEKVSPVRPGEYTAKMKVTAGGTEYTVEKNFTISLEHDTEIVTEPVASDLTYGQTLSESTLTGGEAKIGDDNLAGAFTWKNDTTVPTVEGAKTGYTVVFTPDNDIYSPVEITVKLNVEKAQQNAPEAPIKESATTSSITLAEVENCEYSKDGTNWQDSPTFTGLSVDTEYTFYQRLKGDDNHEPSPMSEEATIRTNAHAHDFTYTANGAVLTATCGNSDGAHTGEISYDLTITAPEKTAYNDGKTAAATLEGLDDFNTATGLTVSASNISYSGTLSDGTTYPASTSAPVNAGTYTASITIGDVTASVEYTISKASQNAPSAPTKASTATSSITLTAVDGCEYSKDGTNWQDSPTFTGLSADTEYTFYQRIKGDNDHDPSPASEGTTIRTNAHAHDFTYSSSGAVLTATCGNSDGAHTGDISYDLTITAPEKTAYNDGKTAAATLEGLTNFNTATGLTVSADDISYSGTLSDGTAYPASTTAPVNAGDYTASITVEGVTASVEYTISKASQNAPDAPTKSDADINSITLTAVENCEYSIDGTTWQDSPTFTGLSADTEYTFYQRLKGNGNYEPSPASEGTAISTNAHVHDFTYSANGATITATCGNSDGAHTGSLTYDLTITAPEKTAFNDDKAAAATLDGLDDFNTATGLTISASDISYSGTLSDGTAYPVSTTAPVNAGDYSATITIGNATAYVDYTISKIDPTVEAPTGLTADYGQTLENVTLPAGWTWQDPDTNVGSAGTNQFPANYTPNDTVNYNSLTGVDVSVNVNAVAPSYQAPQAITGLIYNTIPQALVTAGSTSDGTMFYSLNGTDYSDSVPTGTTVGSYTVYWKVQGDENHTDTEVFTISVGIASTDPTVGAPEAITGLVYNGREQALVTEGTTDGGTMMYSVDGGSYSSDVPTGTDAKDYYVVSYYIQGDDNYNTTDPQTLNVSIAKAPQEAPAPGYTDETVAGLNDGTITGLNDQMEYSTTGTDTDYVAVTGDLTGLEPGTYYIRYAETDNYLASPAAVVTIEAGPQVTITFKTDDENEIASVTGNYGDTVTAPEDPVKDNAKFNGWDKEIPETIPAENMTITAKWIDLTEVSAVPADCENSGMKLYYKDDNGNIYADNHGLNPTTLDKLTVPAKGHTAGDPVQENVVPPTADRSGSCDEVVYCSVCGVELSREKKTIPAQGQNTPAPSPTPTPSYGPSAPYVPSTPAVTDTSAPYTTTSDITNYTITGKMDDHYESELSWDAIPKATDYSLYVKIDGKYVFLQDIGDNTHVDVILSTNGKYYVSTGGKYTVYTYDSKQGKFKKTGTLSADKIDTVKVKNNVINSFMVKYTVDGKITSDNESMKVSVKIYYKPAPKITASKGSVTLKWAKVDGATKYGIYKYVNGKLKLVAETKKLSARISGTKAGQTYTYAVKAFVDGEWTTVTSKDLVTVTAK